MTPNARILWTLRAKGHLLGIHQHIARNSRRRARDYLRRLKHAVEGLRRFPELGSVVEEFGRPDVRELGCRNHRIVYRFDGEKVVVLAVIHGAQDFDFSQLLKD